MGVLTPPEIAALQKVGSPVNGLQKVRVGAREVQWLSRSLKAVGFFNGLKTSEFDQILSAISLLIYPADRDVIREGGIDQGFFVLYAGRVIVSRRRAWRLFASPIKSLLPGDYFGEMAILHQQPRNATVTTTGISAIFHMKAVDFRFVLDKDPDLARRIGQVAEQRKLELEKWAKQ